MGGGDFVRLSTIYHAYQSFIRKLHRQYLRDDPELDDSNVIIHLLLVARKILGLIWEAVYLEHDPVQGRALAGQRHPGGQVILASNWSTHVT